MRYVGYYDTLANVAEERSYAVAATSKMDYIVWSLNRLGYGVEIVSASYTRGMRSCPGRVVDLGDGNRLRLLYTSAWGGRIRRLISIVVGRFMLLWRLLVDVERDESVLVYHSLGYASVVVLAKRIKRFRLVLEVEEVYSDVSGSAKDRLVEFRIFDRADAFIFPSALLGKKVDALDRAFAVAHGSYRVEAEQDGSFDDGRIHVVYAGTFDSRKGGAKSAVKAAACLGELYHIHVIGFGSPDDQRQILELIEEVGCTTECRITHDGLLEGENYIRFIQRCDIGLSTQRRDAKFGDTSFPSKVLSYMANGLRVVSMRMRVLEESGVGDLLFYYEEDTPEAIARAIEAVNIGAPYESRSRLRALDTDFVRNLDGVVSA